jgi:hypothetical protein
VAEYANSVFLQVSSGEDDVRGEHGDHHFGAEFFNISAEDAASNWHPYPNKTTMLLDMLDKQPRTRISERLMELFIFVLRHAGAKNVPSLSKLRTVQKEIHKSMPLPSKRFESPLGNVFYALDIGTLIARVSYSCCLLHLALKMHRIT